MKKLLPLVFSILALSACTTTREATTDDAITPAPRVEIPQENDDYKFDLQNLQSKLGMARSTGELGFTEKRFNSCESGLKTPGSCRSQTFSVIHFQLLCRDSEGSVSNIPVHLSPLTSDRVTWKIGDYKGKTQTDGQGYGQFLMLSEKSVRGQRLILRIGRQFMGFTISDVSKVVLPKNFCQ